MNQRSPELRTLRTDILRARDFIAEHKRAFIGGTAIVATLAAGSVGIESASHSSSSDVNSETKISTPTNAELEKAAKYPASPDEILGTPLIDNGVDTPRIYAQAMAELKDLGLDNLVNTTSVDLTSRYISSQNLIQPDSVFYLVDKKFKGGYDEVIVEVAPPQLETK